MSIIGMMKPHGGTGKEIFTLDEGRVTIEFPATLSGASLEDLRQYLDIFYRKACRLTDDPVDAVDPKVMFGRRDEPAAKPVKREAPVPA